MMVMVVTSPFLASLLITKTIGRSRRGQFHLKACQMCSRDDARKGSLRVLHVRSSWHQSSSYMFAATNGPPTLLFVPQPYTRTRGELGCNQFSPRSPCLTTIPAIKWTIPGKDKNFIKISAPILISFILISS